jgi:hypothetical protein
MTEYQYRDATKRDWIRTITYVALSIAVTVIGAIFLLPAYWYIWLILIAGGLSLLVAWHARKFAYRCPNCGHEFEISAFADFISPQGIGRGGGWKYLRCPACHRRARATVISKRDSSITVE